jgi:hypothetical protein
MVEFVHEFGSLGVGHPQWDPIAPQGTFQFMAAVWQAGQVLDLYEAVLDRDSERARTLLLYDSFHVKDWEQLLGIDPKEERRTTDQEWIAELIDEETKEFYEGDYHFHALETVAEEVEAMVEAHCIPALYLQNGADPSAVSAGWYFRSLLGAG